MPTSALLLDFQGVTGKPLKNVISIGIGGSYLGPEFVYEALRFDPVAKKAAEGRTLRFLANVDPVDVARATEGLNPEETLVIVVSKTFTTAESKFKSGRGDDSDNYANMTRFDHVSDVECQDLEELAVEGPRGP